LLNAKARAQTSTKSEEGYQEAGEPESRKASEASLQPHPDERQVGLDTDRSFVVYPVGEYTYSSRSKTDLTQFV
jgi:hypothetical protein